MKINVDRLCRLAGLNNTSSSKVIKESVMHEEMIDADVEESDVEESDEMIEIDEVMLVQELRRAKKLMQESAKRNAVRQRKKENLLESEIKRIIESEVANVMKDLNLNAGWVYGNNRPKRSQKGYTHQGSYLKGIGFK